MVTEGYKPSFHEQAAMMHDQAREVAIEAHRIRAALDIRGQRREQNSRSIEVKLSTDLSDRQKARLAIELDFLKTYDSRHPVGEAAISKHIWIKFGLNYRSVMELNSRLR